jgi:hypothetical protein
LVELLRLWEGHIGPSIEIAKQLGMKRQQLSRLIREARRVASSTESVDPAFQALHIQLPTEGVPAAAAGIELSWGGDKVVKFANVDLLVDFLRKAA